MSDSGGNAEVEVEMHSASQNGHPTLTSTTISKISQSFASYLAVVGRSHCLNMIHMKEQLQASEP